MGLWAETDKDGNFTQIGMVTCLKEIEAYAAGRGLIREQRICWR